MVTFMDVEKCMKIFMSINFVYPFQVVMFSYIDIFGETSKLFSS